MFSWCLFSKNQRKAQPSMGLSRTHGLPVFDLGQCFSIGDKASGRVTVVCGG
jgi:hypothetical protein